MRLASRPIVLLLLLLACAIVASSRRIHVETASPPIPAIAGCELARDPAGMLRCLLPATDPTHALTIWIDDSPGTSYEVILHDEQGSRSLLAEIVRLDRGTRLRLTVDRPGMLELLATAHDPEAEETVHRRWAVPLALRETTARLDALEDRWIAWNEPSLPHALLDDLAAFDRGASAWEAGRAWELRGEILQHTSAVEGAGGSLQGALFAYERAIELAGPGELFLRCRIGRRIAELHLVDRDSPEDAERAIARMPECDVLGMTHQVPLDYQRGTAAFRRRALAKASAHLERAAVGAERLDLARLGMAAAQQLATAEASMMRFEAAAAAARWARAQAESLPLDCQDRLTLAVHALWIAAQDPAEHPTRRAEALDEVVARRRGCATSASVDAATILTVASALVLERRHPEARRWLDELDEPALTPSNELERASIEADIAMAEHDWVSAAALADELDALIEDHPEVADAAFEAQRELVRGLVAEALHHDVDQARLHLRRAVALQEHQLHLVWLGLAASRVSAREAAAAGHLVRLEREQGNFEAAWCAARLVRNRAGRALVRAARAYAEAPERYASQVSALHEAEDAFVHAEQRGGPGAKPFAKAILMDAQQAFLEALIEDSAPVDQAPEAVCGSLPDPAPGELALLYHRDPDGRWWLFEWSLDAPVRMHDLGGGDPSVHADPEALARRLLEPAADGLAAATRLRLLSSGAIDAIAFESLPWRGRTLEESIPVAWAVDLPARPDRLDVSADALQPVVAYTEPLATLSGLEPSVDALIETIERKWNTQVTRLTDQTASRQELQTLSAGSTVVVIGHNTALDELDVDNPRCRERAPDEPPVAPGRVLRPEHPTDGLWINFTTLDLVTLLIAEPPRVAILESCATAAVDAPSMDGPVGLGQVLVAAGAQQVLATRRKVCVTQGMRLLQALVEASRGRPLDLPRLLRASRHADPHHDHRVLVP